MLTTIGKTLLYLPTILFLMALFLVGCLIFILGYGLTHFAWRVHSMVLRWAARLNFLLSGTPLEKKETK